MLSTSAIEKGPTSDVRLSPYLTGPCVTPVSPADTPRTARASIEADLDAAFKSGCFPQSPRIHKTQSQPEDPGQNRQGRSKGSMVNTAASLFDPAPWHIAFGQKVYNGALGKLPGLLAPISPSIPKQPHPDHAQKFRLASENDKTAFNDVRILDSRAMLRKHLQRRHKQLNKWKSKTQATVDPCPFQDLSYQQNRVDDIIWNYVRKDNLMNVQPLQPLTSWGSEVNVNPKHSMPAVSGACSEPSVQHLMNKRRTFRPPKVKKPAPSGVVKSQLPRALPVVGHNVYVPDDVSDADNYNTSVLSQLPKATEDDQFVQKFIESNYLKKDLPQKDIASKYPVLGQIPNSEEKVNSTEPPITDEDDASAFGSLECDEHVKKMGCDEYAKEMECDEYAKEMECDEYAKEMECNACAKEMSAQDIHNCDEPSINENKTADPTSDLPKSACDSNDERDNPLVSQEPLCCQIEKTNEIRQESSEDLGIKEIKTDSQKEIISSNETQTEVRSELTTTLNEAWKERENMIEMNKKMYALKSQDFLNSLSVDENIPPNFSFQKKSILKKNRKDKYCIQGNAIQPLSVSDASIAHVESLNDGSAPAMGNLCSDTIIPCVIPKQTSFLRVSLPMENPPCPVNTSRDSVDNSGSHTANTCSKDPCPPPLTPRGNGVHITPDPSVFQLYSLSQHRTMCLSETEETTVLQRKVQENNFLQKLSHQIVQDISSDPKKSCNT